MGLFSYYTAARSTAPVYIPGDNEYEAYRMRVEADGGTITNTTYCRGLFRFLVPRGLLAICATWYDALCGVKVSGGVVQKVYCLQNTINAPDNDYTSYIPPAGQGVQGPAPLWIASGLNGKPEIRYRGGELSRLFVDVSGNNQAHWFTLSQVNQNTGFIVEHSNNYNASGTFTTLREGDLMTLVAQLGGGSASWVTESKPLGTYLITGSVNRNRSSKLVRQRVNGVLSTTYAADNINTGNFPSSPLVVGGRPEIPTYRLDNNSFVNVASVFRAELSTTYEQEIEQVIRAGYGYAGL